MYIRFRLMWWIYFIVAEAGWGMESGLKCATINLFCFGYYYDCYDVIALIDDDESEVIDVYILAPEFSGAKAGNNISFS